MNRLSKHRVLFVGREAAGFPELKAGLFKVHPEWEVDLALGGVDAIQSPQGRPDVIFVDFHLPDGIAMPLLDSIRQSEPDCIRFLSGVQSPDPVMIGKCAWSSLRLFTQPMTVESVSRAIERAFELDVWLSNKKVQELVSQMRSFPSLPTLYFKIVQEISSKNVSIEKLAELIGGDLAIHSKIIQVVNSAFYGRTDQISDLEEAIAVLGIDTVQSLVLAVQAFAQMDKVKPVYFSIDTTWRHSLAVGKRAQQIAQRHSGDLTCVKEAHTAALLHDIGKVVFACNLDAEYKKAASLAEKDRIPLFRAERMMFGATHADIGAYLAALWALPKSVVEAVGWHHEPALSKDESFSPLTAVHLANALEHKDSKDTQSPVHPGTDSDYLKRLGLNEYIEVPSAVEEPNQDQKQQQAKPPQNVAPVPKRPAGNPNPMVRKQARAFACGVAVGAVLCLIAVWLVR